MHYYTGSRKTEEIYLKIEEKRCKKLGKMVED